jgi:hypothetical protein
MKRGAEPYKLHMRLRATRKISVGRTGSEPDLPLMPALGRRIRGGPRFVPVILIGFVSFYAAPVFGQHTKIQLNENAFAYAQELITRGHVVCDKKNDWGDHHPTTADQNDFIRAHGFAEYANWHLGINAAHAQNTKARYKFPFGDFKNLHRSAVLAVKSRAHQFGYSDIEKAAARLLQMMESKERR